VDVSLVMVKPDGSSKEIRLDRESATLGRDEACRIRIPLNSISRRHCEVRLDGDALTVADLGSSNGTFVNSKRVRQAELAPGDLLCIGPVVFVVRIDGHPKSIDAKDSYAAGSITDENDDTGELLSPVAPTKAAPPRAPAPAGSTHGGGGPPATGPMAKGPAKSDDDDDDEDISDILKDFDFGEDDDDPPAKKK